MQTDSLPLADDRVLSVTALNRQARLLLEGRFKPVWVRGEISNYRRPGSGHWYFTLKDDNAQVRCAMFVNRNRFSKLQPADGAEVIVRGRVSLYEGRGDYQIIVEQMERAGEGALRAAFEALKERLAAEGLFAAERKKPLPRFPAHLAIISSASGAALRDVLSIVQRRFPCLAVTLLPVAVQGPEAEGQILQALKRVPALEPDLVMLTRGGGSLEDLSVFNSEPLARAIANCPVATVAAIGHETDFTIAELVADLRRRHALRSCGTRHPGRRGAGAAVRRFRGAPRPRLRDPYRIGKAWPRGGALAPHRPAPPGAAAHAARRRPRRAAAPRRDGTHGAVARAPGCAAPVGVAGAPERAHRNPQRHGGTLRPDGAVSGCGPPSRPVVKIWWRWRAPYRR